MPRICAFYGIDIYMYFRDHSPPHFHAQYGDAEAAINIETLEIIAGDLPARATRLVAEWAEQHQSELLENWQRARNHDPLRTLTHSIEMPKILRITEMEQVGTYSLRVTFNDETTKRVTLRPLLWGEVFEPLRDPDQFSEVYLDEEMGTVAWPNGADFAPEALYELEDEQAVA